MKVVVVLFALLCVAYCGMPEYWQRKSKEFLDKKYAEEGVVKTDSGLAYKVLESGKGEVSPQSSDKVLVHYKGTLIDGKQFDSSFDRGQPIEFGVTQVIPGWTEALQLMKIGDKWEVYIPWQLGYGDRGAGGDIKPYQTLVFVVHLLAINGKEEL